MKKAAILFFALFFLLASAGVAWAEQGDSNGIPFQEVWGSINEISADVSAVWDSLNDLSGQVDSFFDVFMTKADHDSDIDGLQASLDSAKSDLEGDIDGLQAQIDSLQSQIDALEATCQECCDEEPPACVPEPEICDGLDNDCDEEIDEGLGVADSCGECVDLDDPSTYGDRIEYDATYKRYILKDDVLLCQKTYTLEASAGLQARLENGDSRILNCNGATLSSVGGQVTAIFATCNQNAAYATGCTPDFRVMNCNIDNFYNGITVKLIDGAQVLNNSVSGGGGGITLSGVQGGTVKGNTVDGANYSGISLRRNQSVPYTYQRRSESNDIIGNSVTDTNGYGLQLDTSLYNTIKDNTVTGSKWYGLYVYDSGYNTIYNNYLSNTKNAFEYAANWANDWSVDKTAGTNIVGGPYLGGNFWDDYTGTDTDGDGLGDTDTPYRLYSLNGTMTDGGDNRPLVE